jgi:NADH-quinone oxidoreductase subunit J
LTGAGAISAGLQPSATTEEFLKNGGTVESIGISLFSGTQPWLFPFEVTSILLLVGIVGAIVLAKRKI